MNNVPYNPGHLMVLPNREVADLSGLSAEERSELLDLVIRAQAALTAVMRPTGFNIGLNLGKVAGAGIPQHLHAHVVPRWEGDHNFMPVTADTHVLPQALEELWEKLAAAFPAA
jgi:ATP adenylyltransferase